MRRKKRKTQRFQASVDGGTTNRDEEDQEGKGFGGGGG